MKARSLLLAIAVMIGLSSSAFAMHSNVQFESQRHSNKCGFQPVALDPHQQLARCY